MLIQARVFPYVDQIPRVFHPCSPFSPQLKANHIWEKIPTVISIMDSEVPIFASLPKSTDTTNPHNGGNHSVPPANLDILQGLRSRRRIYWCPSKSLWVSPSFWTTDLLCSPLSSTKGIEKLISTWSLSFIATTIISWRGARPRCSSICIMIPSSKMIHRRMKHQKIRVLDHKSQKISVISGTRPSPHAVPRTRKRRLGGMDFLWTSGTADSLDPRLGTTVD